MACTCWCCTGLAVFSMAFKAVPGVVVSCRITSRHAICCRLPIVANVVVWLTLALQTTVVYVTIGLTIVVSYYQRVIFGFKPQRCPTIRLHIPKAILAVFTVLAIWQFHFRVQSRVIPRYLIYVEIPMALPPRIGSTSLSGLYACLYRSWSIARVHRRSAITPPCCNPHSKEDTSRSPCNEAFRLKHVLYPSRVCWLVCSPRCKWMCCQKHPLCL